MEAPAVVTGAVAFPGPIPVQRNTVRVRDLVNRAGGPLEGAVLARILLTRRVAADTVQVGDPSGTRRFVQNLTSRGILESTVDLTQGDGPYVEPGDVIQVPRVGGFVQVLGQVRRPGTYDYREGWRPRDYVDEAGGYAQQADTRQTRVTQGQQGTVVFANDIETLAPGDMIWVPEKPPGSFWQVLRDATFLITSAATLYLLVREATR